MNKVILIGRPVQDPEIKYTSGDNPKAIAKYTLAVNRNFGKDNQVADFISCVAFGKNAEFAEKYLAKGKRIAVVGRIQTGSYTNKDGKKVYTTDVVVEQHEFVENKNAQPDNSNLPLPTNDDFMSIPDNVDDEDLPFN